MGSNEHILSSDVVVGKAKWLPFAKSRKARAHLLQDVERAVLS